MDEWAIIKFVVFCHSSLPALHQTVKITSLFGKPMKRIIWIV